MPTVATPHEFLELLDSSNLLTAEQLADARGFGDRGQNPQSIAKQLVGRNWLTVWQAQQLLAGRSKLFLGKYKLLEAIGKGGMGVVFKAEQPSQRRVVALKVMSKSLLNSTAAITRFAREILTVGSLNHPNIVAAHDAHCVDDTHFLVMEYVAGKNLKSWIRQYGQLPIDWSCEICRQVAQGLQHAYERGMVHRDMKPSNLLIVEQDASLPPLVKILDFGMARFVSETRHAGELTQTGEVMGTPDYIAPEQARSTKDADIRADIYSLGCSLYEMLTGRVPFEGRNIMEKLLARATQDPPHVWSLRPDVPQALDQVVYRMMAREPAHRFQTPADVALALAPFTDRAALQSAQQAQHFVQETPTQPAIIGADTDDTLQGFINQLANKAVDEPSSPPRASSVRPAPAPQSSGSADDGSKNRPNSIGIAGAPFGILAVGVLVVAFFPRGERTVPQPQPKFVTETFVDGDGSGKTSRTDDRSVAFWVLSIDGSVELSVRGQKAYYKVLPEGKFVVAGIKLFNNAQVSDADLKQLAALKSLETLTLRGTQITSDGLSQLSQLKSLRQLNIADTEVDDAGLEHLRGLSKLEELTLPAGSVSPAAVRKLQTALRDCRISRE